MAKPNVLVIDDEPAVRDAFCLALRDAYEVATAADGEEGLRQARKQKPDLIFLDLRMPGIDGVETLRRLQPLYPEVPIYIVTAFQKEFMAALRQIAEEGFRFHVADKPLDLMQIQLVTRSVLDKPQVI